MIYILTAAALFGLDFILKRKIDKRLEQGQEIHILKDRVIVRKYYNQGAILDSLKQWPRLVQLLSGLVLLGASFAFLLLLPKKGKKGMKLGLALIIGGGAGNLYDRMERGHVIDYFSFRSRFSWLKRVVFNLSDLFIFLGAFLVLVFQKRK